MTGPEITAFAPAPLAGRLGVEDANPEVDEADVFVELVRVTVTFVL